MIVKDTTICLRHLGNLSSQKSKSDIKINQHGLCASRAQLRISSLSRLLRNDLICSWTLLHFRDSRRVYRKGQKNNKSLHHFNNSFICTAAVWRGLLHPNHCLWIACSSCTFDNPQELSEH